MLNKAQIIGYVGKDPEIHVFNNGDKVATFSIATSETYKNKEGEKVTNTEWHTIKVFKKMALVVESYVKKGQLLYVDGTIKYKTFETDGKTTYFTEIHVQSLKMLGKSAGTQTAQSAQAAPKVETEQEVSDEIGGQGLPF